HEQPAERARLRRGAGRAPRQVAAARPAYHDRLPRPLRLPRDLRHHRCDFEGGKVKGTTQANLKWRRSRFAISNAKRLLCCCCPRRAIGNSQLKIAAHLPGFSMETTRATQQDPLATSDRKRVNFF